MAKKEKKQKQKPIKQKTPQQRKKRKAVDHGFRIQMGISCSFLVFLSLLGFLWIMSASQLEEYNTETSTPDGIVEVKEPVSVTQDWQGAVGNDFEKLPEVVEGFNKDKKPLVIPSFHNQNYTASTSVYVLTKQTPAELGINQNSITQDGKGYFTWGVGYNGHNIEASRFDPEKSKKDWQKIYSDDLERLKEYINDKDYSWYSLTYSTDDKDILSQKDSTELVRSVFGSKLDPNRSIILYNYGTLFKKVN